jgi:hypothetical protein
VVNFKRLALIGALAALALGGLARAQIAQDEPAPAPRLQKQPGGEPAEPGIAGQGGDEKSLEISPQPGAALPQPDISEIPSERKFAPSEESARLSPKFVPGRSGDGRPRACLGLLLKPATKCFHGVEVHGLEVTQIIPDGPAVQAGIKKRADAPLAGVGAAAQALLGPLGMAFMPLQEQAELKRSGDLIVAVADVRIHSENELRHELDKLKPGDLVYLTMMRALPSGAAQTRTTAIKVGEWRQGKCLKAPPTESAAAPRPPSRPGAEIFTD